MFDRVGEIVYKPAAGDADAMMEAAIEAGAEDVESDEEGHTIICAFEDIGEVSQGAGSSARRGGNRQDRLEAAEHASRSTRKRPQSLMKLIDMLDDDDDVQNVYSNEEISDEVMAKLSA